MVLERNFQAEFIGELKLLFEGCIVLKNDANYIQGFPDLLMLHGDRWAAFECKRSISARRQPNQEYYVELLNGMSYSAFVCPENKEQVLYELQRSFEL